MSTQTNKNLIERLFQSGAHFGFSKSRRHPSVVNHVFGTKNGSDILDIEQSSEKLSEIITYLETAGKNGKSVLFVGTKDEVSRLVKEAAEKAGVHVVYHRWIGGMLTNFPEIKKRIKRLIALKADKDSGELEKKYTKKERVMIAREVQKLEQNFGGISTLEKVPDIMVVVDTRNDSIAVAEANQLNIPVIGIVSSDCDISLIAHPIVVNDSLTSSVSLVLNELAEAYKKGKSEFTPKATPAKKTFTRRG